MWKDRYRSHCSELGVEPRAEVLAFTGGSLVIEGNTFDNFLKRLGDAELEAIVRAAGQVNNVSELILPYNNLTSRGALSIPQMLQSGGLDTLMSVDLSHNSIDGEAAIALFECMRRNPGGSITSVTLQGNALGGGCSPALREMLRVNTSLLHLNLYNTDLDMKALTDICFALRSNSTLVSLNIGKPLISNPDDIFYVVHHLSLFLADSTALLELDLSHFGLVDSNLQALLPSLSSSGVVVCSLRGNKLSQDGGELLGRLLERKQDFVCLDVSANRLRDVGAAAVARSVKAHTNLQALYLNNNTIGEKGIIAVADAVRACLCLRRLTLWGNDFDGEAVKELFAINDRLKQLEYADFELCRVRGEPAIYRAA